MQKYTFLKKDVNVTMTVAKPARRFSHAMQILSH